MKVRNRKRRSVSINVEQMEGRLLMSAAPQFTIKDLGVVDSITGLNDYGQVVGVYMPDNSQPQRAYISEPNGGSIRNLGTLPGEEAVWSESCGINNSGQVVGTSGFGHTFLSDPNGGTLHKVGGDAISGLAVNAKGQISGDIFVNGDDRGFLTDPNGDTIHILIATGYTEAFSVNDLGQVTGRTHAVDSNGFSTQHAFLTDPNGGSLHDIGTLPTESYSQGNSVNNKGQVVGRSGNLAFVSEPNGGALHYLGNMPGLTVSSANDINDFGEIVGTGYDGTKNHAFVDLDGTLYDLNNLIPTNSGFALQNGVSVNNNGQVAVEATDSSGTTHALLLTPVPPAPITPTITWSNPADIVYGTPISATQLNATADVPGTFTYSVAQGTVLHAGVAQSIVATFTPTDTNFYTTATVTDSINVLPAPLTVTANNATKIQGQVNPTFTGTIVGLVNGDTDVITYSTTATTSSIAGTYAIVPWLADGNYSITFINGTLTVTPNPSGYRPPPTPWV